MYELHNHTPPPNLAQESCAKLRYTYSSHICTADLILVFFAGVLLTLLLTAMVFLIIKSCRRCKWCLRDGAALSVTEDRDSHERGSPLLQTPLVRLVPLLPGIVAGHYSPQDPDPHPDSPAKRSSLPEDPLTYASMSFQPLEKKSHSLTANHSADLDPVVYAQVKATSQ
ncbi:LOW QUALITY PROTEIN: transmembrane protein C1orf162 homolog [Callospermophilus lateralis]|uniref:LOW QUALITY PROTEIN: transmembrane protein C1orf162 homolog n=1 Tax=Callospermophilus lateralis TaxID=76772 RepID=UPI00403888EF